MKERSVTKVKKRETVGRNTRSQERGRWDKSRK